MDTPDLELTRITNAEQSTLKSSKYEISFNFPHIKIKISLKLLKINKFVKLAIVPGGINFISYLLLAI